MRHLLAILLFLALTYNLDAQDCTFQLSGHVQDKDSKENLQGATITIAEQGVQVITDANGNFKHSGLCGGTYSLEVSHVGCETVYTSVRVVRNMHIDIQMPHLRSNLEEVVVQGRKSQESAAYRKELDREALALTAGTSLAEALGGINGVTIMHTGSTISKPVIHGLHGARVLTINNGVRQEGQQWGNEHAPEVDVYIADKLSVVRGVDELKYGSDAIGGVILVEPRAIRSLPGYQAELNSAWFTNNNQFVVSGIAEHKPEKIAALGYRLQGTYKSAANVRTPGYTLNNTGTDERNFSAAADWKKEHYRVSLYYSEFSARVGIFPGAHVGNLTDLLNVLQRNKPDEVFLGERSRKIGRPRQEVIHRLFKLSTDMHVREHRFNFLFSGQYNHRDEFDIVRNRDNTKPQVSLAIITLTQDLSYEHPQIKNWRGTVGLSLMQQNNSYSGRYLVPNYSLNNYGAYWIEKWRRGKVMLEAGLRVDNKAIHTERLRYGGQQIDHDFRFLTFASSFSAAVKIAETFRVNGGVQLSSRSPQVNELLMDGIHDGAGIYVRGDIGLRTEKSINVFSGLNYNGPGKKFYADLHLYYNPIDRFIYQQPLPDEPVSTIVGTFPLRKYLQTDVVLTGVDISSRFRLYDHLEWSASASMLLARNRQLKDWLILMPADRISNEFAWHFPDSRKVSNAFVKTGVVHVFRPRVPSDEWSVQDYKPPPDGYTLISLQTSAELRIFNAPVTFGIEATNLFNKKYRDYLNSFRYYTDEMGRNFIFRLRIPIGDIHSRSHAKNMPI